MRVAVVHPRDTAGECNVFRAALAGRNVGGFGFAPEFATFEPELLALAAGLSAAGAEVTYHDENLGGRFSPDHDGGRVYDLVVVGGVACQMEGALAIAQAAGRGRRPLVCLVGPHASLDPAGCLAAAPLVLMGNPAQGAPTLLRAVARGISGVVAADPAADWRTDYGLLPRPLPAVFPVVASRGCDRGCRFCAAARARPVHRRPPAAVAAEFAAIRSLRPDAAIVLVDDNLFGDPPWLDALCAELAPLGIRFAAHGDIGGASDPAAVGRLAAAGLARIFLGLESLSPAVLAAHAPAKAALLPRYVELVGRFQAAGVAALVSFVVGFDGEGDAPSDIRRFCAEVMPAGLTVSLLTPMPGTPLHAEYERAGRIVERRLSRYTQFYPVIAFERPVEELVRETADLLAWFHSQEETAKRIRRFKRG